MGNQTSTIPKGSLLGCILQKHSVFYVIQPGPNTSWEMEKVGPSIGHKLG